MRKNQKGFSVVEVLIVLLFVGVVGAIGFNVFRTARNKPGQNATTQTPSKKNESKVVAWSFDGTNWKASGTPPACANPLVLKSPVDLSLASAILYPGQTRNLYKPHGGFLFANKKNTDIKVYAPLDGDLVGGSRYLEGGEIQYILDVINPCGIWYRFDHLLTLAPEVQKLADTLPEAKPDDSRTANFKTPKAVKAGEVLATAVGHTKPLNVGMDFGVYDLRQPNEASKNAAYAKAHQNESNQTFYATCWLNLLGADSAKAKALPGGDQKAGKTSDYCK